MIQKYRDATPPMPGDDRGLSESTAATSLGVLNDDEAILVLVDEAHRSQARRLHANLLEALPNCARIGFTGTPIIMGAKKRTHEIFGEFIDRYTSASPRPTAPPCRSSTRAAPPRARWPRARDLDELFEDMFPERTAEELRGAQAQVRHQGRTSSRRRS